MNALYGVIESLGRIGTLPWVLLGVALYLTFTRLKTGKRRNVAVILILGVFAAVPGRWAWERQQRVERYRAAEALFKERCRTQAGYRIHKVVEDVDGIQVLKIRRAFNTGDPMAPSAAFALESTDEGYISNFLAYRYPSTQSDNSYMASTTKNPGAIPGFSYVDVIDEKDGKRYRYSGRWKEPWLYDKNYLKGYIKFFLDRVPAPEPAPRYAVTFEDAVLPEERAVGLASSTVKVLDTQTNEVLGEMVRYVFHPGVGKGPSGSWQIADKCPGVLFGSGQATRQFVDHVLVARGATLPPPLK